MRLLLESKAKKLEVVAEASCNPLNLTVLEFATDNDPETARVPDTANVSVGEAVPIPTRPPVEYM